jgi:hypothetical protein
VGGPPSPAPLRTQQLKRNFVDAPSGCARPVLLLKCYLLQFRLPITWSTIGDPLTWVSRGPGRGDHRLGSVSAGIQYGTRRALGEPATDPLAAQVPVGPALAAGRADPVPVRRSDWQSFNPLQNLDLRTLCAVFSGTVSSTITKFVPS